MQNQSKFRVLLIFGTRPEAIKMCPLVRVLEEACDQLDVAVCVTAQHRQMLDQVLPLFDVKPRWDLNVMQTNQDLYTLTSSVLVSMRAVLDEFQPDIVLVQGDTTTTFAAALAAFYKKITVGHVEAGLRTGNPYSPWPEEINRKLTGQIARFHFPPTESSRENLLRENIAEDRVFVTGNTVIDAMFHVLQKIESDNSLAATVKEELARSFGDKPFDARSGRKFLLVTGHRRESFGEGFLNICHALRVSAEKHPDVDFIYPVHRNPNVVNVVSEKLSGVPNIRLIEPLSYAPFLYLLSHCYFVVTDSGGIQEEAPSLGKPVLVTRDNTERPEAVTAGTVQLVGTNRETIAAGIDRLLTDKSEYQKMSRAINPYGDGLACQRIKDRLLSLAAAKRMEHP